MNGSGLRLRSVSVDFDGRSILHDVSLTVTRGEIVAILGPSGSGKSTLLRLVAGLVEPTSGAVIIDDTDVTSVPTHRRGVGLVFQNNQLFPHLDVAANIAYGLRVAGMPVDQRRDRVSELLALVGMPGFGSREVATLSGGEAARVALARSLATSPRVVLLDEPLSGLDHDLRYSLADDVRRVVRAAGSTAVVVTHDPDEARRIADRVVTLAELSSDAQ
ncbi:MAG: ABC transporter ATP-binding protein [Acidobacteria bacterium]|nr:ABC transporter ATP-binding protein [Acidobacteriota bacterium]